MRNEKLLGLMYIMALFGLFLYSFTQIDLSLTFSQNEFLLNLVKAFQNIGYFNRPLSTVFFLILLMVLFGFYLFFLYRAHKRQLRTRFVWLLLIAATTILTFSYNAFSYDLFNYIFDAKIITHYHQNPYEHKALDYAGDPMLSFMRWTHRTYPYGPVWLGVTVPLSFLGFGLFLPTFFLFKLLSASAFLGSLWFISKIFKKLSPEKETFGLVFFGLNPLVLIESLVSSHIDIVMIFLSLWSFYLLIQKKYVFSLFVLLLSVGTKFATGFLLPLSIIVLWFHYKRKKISWDTLSLLSVALLLVTVIIASARTTFQPWYLLPVLAFAAFLSYRYFILLPGVILSFGALITYTPYLYLGNWDPPVPVFLTTLYVISCATSFFLVVLLFSLKRFRKR